MKKSPFQVFHNTPPEASDKDKIFLAKKNRFPQNTPASHRWLRWLWFPALCACTSSALLMRSSIDQPQEVSLSSLKPTSQEKPPPFVLEQVANNRSALAVTGWGHKPKQKLPDSLNMDRIEVLLHNGIRTLRLPTFMQQRKKLLLQHKPRDPNSGFRSRALNCLMTPGGYSIPLHTRHDGNVQLTDTHETLIIA